MLMCGWTTGYQSSTGHVDVCSCLCWDVCYMYFLLCLSQQLLNGRVHRNALWLPENPYQTTPPKATTDTTTQTQTSATDTEAKNKPV